ncbi:MAG: hypothetical protein H5U40_13170, partial [Polyangiaceae bacterium]|nr:hypothetical protein [Polyangiaceae bacterium]
MQWERDVAILDEVDSLLLDEALTPLVIGGGGRVASGLFRAAIEAVERLRVDVDYDVEDDALVATLTEEGFARVEAHLRELGALGSGGLHDADNADLARIVHRALRALLMRRDRDYLVTESGAVVPLDRHTGRALEGRRYGDGLQQALEAKERVSIHAEHRTRASCSYERFLLGYRSVSGMTGTARGIERELEQVHGLRVHRLEPHRPCIREDDRDRFFVTEREKLAALAEEVERCHARGVPVLVGVPSEEKALVVSRVLRARGIPHRSLTAKHHAIEAAIVAGAGREGAVTVATQVAGRGTDIALGSERVRSLGGLRVLGLERHLRRRVDDQLRGRAGRGGDPGSSCFFVSLEDELLARHASPSARSAIRAIAAITDDVARELRAYVDDAQERFEQAEADRRVTGRKLDAVFEEQRRAVEAIRASMLSGKFAEDEGSAPGGRRLLERTFEDGVRKPVERLVEAHVRAGSIVRPRTLVREAYRLFGCEVELEGHETSARAVVERLVVEVGASLAAQWMNMMRIAEGTTERDIGGDRSADDRARAAVREALVERGRRERPRRVLRYFRLVYLDELARAWSEHLEALMSLRDDLVIRFYARTDPFVAYKREAYEAFRAMIAEVDRAAIARLLSAPPIDHHALEALQAELEGAQRRAVE